jgi:antibiotic biosynthesis monooxygenase (ABM) superfamily enzyme
MMSSWLSLTDLAGTTLPDFSLIAGLTTFSLSIIFPLLYVPFAQVFVVLNCFLVLLTFTVVDVSLLLYVFIFWAHHQADQKADEE